MPLEILHRAAPCRNVPVTFALELMEVRHMLSRVRKGASVAVVVLCALSVLWLVVCKLFLAFTPLWLDLASVAAGGLGALILWAIGNESTAKDER